MARRRDADGADIGTIYEEVWNRLAECRVGDSYEGSRMSTLELIIAETGIHHGLENPGGEAI